MHGNVSDLVLGLEVKRIKRPIAASQSRMTHWYTPPNGVEVRAANCMSKEYVSRLSIPPGPLR